MEQTDYSNIFLTEKEQQAFNKFMTTDIAELEESEFNLLKAKKLVKGKITPDSGFFDIYPEDKMCTITPLGKGLREYQQKKHKEQIAENEKRKEIQQIESKRYRITTAIAISALVISTLSLLLSAYTVFLK